jgi:choline-sulfatase
MASARPHRSQPNFLVVICDQLSLDAIAAHGCRYTHTPNLDRLIERGVTFIESHSTNPVCSPARSSVFTGRMPVETGVITNTRPIHDSVPDLGQWLGQNGYDCAYCGKWHLPDGWPSRMKGFEVLPVGGAQGDLVDIAVAETCEGFLLHHTSPERPFALVASFLQPHDICYWAIANKQLVPEQLPFAHLRDQLPPLPPNNEVRPPAPAKLDAIRGPMFTPEQWRYYLYIYHRQVEMLDADVGRLLNALEQSGLADDTIVVFTSDHGEGGGRHSHVQKWYPYEESVKVPLIVSCPARIQSGVRDTAHLVSGLDIVPTLCDFAGIPAPPHQRGYSLRPLLQDRAVEWREFLVSEHHVVGRMVRTADFKFVQYEDDPVEQLFRIHEDPWEMNNLYDQARYADTIADHRRILEQWRGCMLEVPPTPVLHG